MRQNSKFQAAMIQIILIIISYYKWFCGRLVLVSTICILYYFFALECRPGFVGLAVDDACSFLVDSTVCVGIITGANLVCGVSFVPVIALFSASFCNRRCAAIDCCVVSCVCGVFSLYCSKNDTSSTLRSVVWCHAQLL